MSTINDGGPAFPQGDDGSWGTGMTLRDWFAGQALAGLLRDGIDVHGIGDSAYLAYEMADAMLRAREVKP
jgi:hypothetical protein